MKRQAPDDRHRRHFALHYLVLIKEVEVLPRLFQQVLIPEEVFEELTDDAAPPTVRDWANSQPAWLGVRTVDTAASAAITELDAGEEAAIRLAEEHPATAFLLIDDSKGRRIQLLDKESEQS